MYEFEDDEEEEDEDDDRYIPGVYNYCDRWCERCRFQSRCRSFAMEQEIQGTLLLQRSFEPQEEPEPKLQLPERTGDPEPAVAPSIVGSIDMLLRLAADSEYESRLEAEDADSYSRLHSYEREPLFHRANEWGDRLGNFLERISAERPDVVPAEWREESAKPGPD